MVTSSEPSCGRQTFANFKRLSLRRLSEDVGLRKGAAPAPPPKPSGSEKGARADSASLPLGQVDIILAESDDAIVEVVKANLVSVGVSAGNIKLADDELGAMELVLAAQAGEEGRPLMLLLNTDMPNMDGHECASWAFAMDDRGVLMRPPYIVVYSMQGSTPSSGHGGLRPADVPSHQHCNAVLPAEALSPELSGTVAPPLLEVFSAFREWWLRRQQVPGADHRLCNFAGATFIIADHWPICRMMLTLALQKNGILSRQVQEADDSEEALELLQGLLARPAAKARADGPIVVFLRRQLPPTTGAQCAVRMRELLAQRSRAFLVCVSAEGAASAFSGAEREAFNCFLPQASSAEDLSWVLQLCRLWWSERRAADEPAAAEPAGGGLASAMERWRERSERRRRAREAEGCSAAASGGVGGSYGAQIRRRSRMSVPITHENVAQALEAEWPGQCSCQAEPLLGSGGQAEVYLGRWHPRGGEARPAAVKVFRMHPGTTTWFQRELAISKSLQHPNLVAVYGSISAPLPLIVQEYCAGGSLHDLLHKSSAATVDAPSLTAALTMEQRLKIALDVARGMVLLHALSPAVVHRDLKSGNVLLAQPVRSSQAIPLAKVADFGLARVTKSQGLEADFMTKGAGSLRWMAPEVINGSDYGLPADVYSYGSLLFELLTYSIPFGEDRSLLPQPLECFVENGGRPDAGCLGRSILHMLERFPTWLTSLMRSSWQQDPASRPGFAEVVQQLMEHGSDPLVGVAQGAGRAPGGVIQLRLGQRGRWERVMH